MFWIFPALLLQLGTLALGNIYYFSGPCKDDGFADTQRLLVHRYADRLESDPRTLADIGLASFIASGRIHKQSTVYCMLRLIGEKAMKVDQGRVQVNQASLTGVADEHLNEVGFFLSSTLKDARSMESFGVQAKHNQTFKAIPTSSIDIPNPYMSIATPAALQGSARTALQNLDAHYTREFCLVFDETVFGPGFWGIQDDPEFMGGCRSIMNCLLCCSRLHPNMPVYPYHFPSLPISIHVHSTVPHLSNV